MDTAVRFVLFFMAITSTVTFILRSGGYGHPKDAGPVAKAFNVIIAAVYAGALWWAAFNWGPQA